MTQSSLAEYRSETDELSGGDLMVIGSTAIYLPCLPGDTDGRALRGVAITVLCFGSLV